MKVTSPDFKQGEMIPKRFTCDGEDVSPTLQIENLPSETKTLVLIMDDPDAPSGTFLHWVVFNIPPTQKIPSGTKPPGIQGRNDFNKNGYGGPCPPKGTGVHRYFFHIYALKTDLSLKEGVSLQEVNRAMKDHIIDKAELMGKYTKDKI